MYVDYSAQYNMESCSTYKPENIHVLSIKNSISVKATKNLFCTVEAFTNNTISNFPQLHTNSCRKHVAALNTLLKCSGAITPGKWSLK